ncbi:unnamed protein product [Didymodactylos carnosus]|uniref:33 kDa inner dynein arm light chain, axonemal n=1 Tax=Didymodactylos carnosus TaxID=1234261 RepID=A0A814M5B5_9BILA|nr:unnamed protein product [Didymodactylos carnosus]CAF1357938.1 unnamed protein product [Didymodactylos carnosus]CAF3840315.1 unnamed protein product [Didymodactylos carnosus]CAF4168293.1 unnamed protein product [Didymodactylos carnosus]
MKSLLAAVAPICVINYGYKHHPRMTCKHVPRKYYTDSIIAPKNALLKYGTHRLIISKDLSDKEYTAICRATILPNILPVPLHDINLKLLNPYSQACRNADILDFLFKPLEFIDKYNHKYVLCVSRTPATKTDVFMLQENLDKRLKEDQALEVGLCPRRREIYDECLNEIVRHVTIECGERGILLARIRDDFLQLIKDYSTIYISANAYAFRTILLNEQIKSQLRDRVNKLEYDTEKIRKQLFNAEDHLETVVEMKASAMSERFTIKLPVELQQLRLANKVLKTELENVLGKKLKLSEKEKDQDKVPILDEKQIVTTTNRL